MALTWGIYPIQPELRGRGTTGTGEEGTIDGCSAVAGLLGRFCEHFAARGYKEVPAVAITSGLDRTVRFIGSHISVLKPALLAGTIPPEGLFIVQPCVRTRNLQHLTDPSFLPNWGSYFPSMGVLTRGGQQRRAVADLFSLLLESFDIPLPQIAIRISSSDRDLMDLCSSTGAGVTFQIDTRPRTYYRHRIGEPGILGRNFNIALRGKNSGDEFNDVGNLILLESNGTCLGIETALGATTIVKEQLGLAHVLDCTPVYGIPDHIDTSVHRRLEDIVVTCVVLYREGLRPSARDNRSRLLKAYIFAGITLCQLAHTAVDSVVTASADFEKRTFGQPYIADILASDIRRLAAISTQDTRLT